MSLSNGFPISCDNPRTIINRHYALMDPADRIQYSTQLDYYITIPCGRCRLCKNKLAKEWKVRLHYELQSCPRHRVEGVEAPRCMFITLTLSDEYLTDDDKFFAPWFVRFRDNYRKKYGSSPRYYAVTDRGSQFGRLHLHMLLFNPTPSVNELHKLLKSWYPYGFYDIKWIYNDCVYDYVTNYITGSNLYKDDPVKHGKPVCEKALKHKPKVYVSKGLGRDCVDKDYILNRGDNLVDINGFLYSLPRYYRDKWIDERERFYYRVINLHHADYLASQYGYDFEKVRYRYNGKIVDKYSLDNLRLDSDRFTALPKEKPPVTDWDSAFAYEQHRQYLINEFDKATFEFADPLANTYHGLNTYYEPPYWDRLTKDFPF